MFKNMNMGEKVMGSLFALAVIVAFVGLMGILGMSRINKSLNDVASVNLPGLTALEIISEAKTAIQRDERTLLLRSALSNEEKVRLARRLEGAWKRVEAAWNIYEPLSKSPEAESAWNKFKPAWETWKKDQQRVFNLAKEDRRTEATTISLGAALKSFNKAEELLGDVIAGARKDAKADIAGANTVAGILKWVLISLIVLSIGLAAVIVIRINRDMAHFLTGLRLEVSKIVNAVSGGMLTERGDPEKVDGEFREIIQGFNETLDALVGPLNVVADYLAKTSRGEIPQVITDNYNGEFNLLKNNLNACIDAAAGEVAALQKVAAGDLSVRISVRDERDIVAQSFNQAIAHWDDLRSEIAKLILAAKDGMVYERGRTEHLQGAYAEILQGINRMQSAIEALVRATSLLAQVVADGDFAKRIDTAKHLGYFRQVASSVNAILNSVTETLKVASEYKERMARGEISPKISDNSPSAVNDIFFQMITQNKPYY